MPRTIRRHDLAYICAEGAGIKKKVALRFLEVLFESIQKQLKKGGRVTWHGFGTFLIKQRTARMCPNPQNLAQKIQVPALKIPCFRPGKTLKDSLR